MLPHVGGGESAWFIPQSAKPSGFLPRRAWHTKPSVNKVLHLHRARRPVEPAAPRAVAKQSAGWFYCLVLVKLEVVFVLKSCPDARLAAAFIAWLERSCSPAASEQELNAGWAKG